MEEISQSKPTGVQHIDALDTPTYNYSSFREPTEGQVLSESEKESGLHVAPREKLAGERKLLWKLDLVILPLASLLLFVAYLVRQKAAYVLLSSISIEKQ